MENFTLFSDSKKLTAKNHQFLGVNNALEAVRRIGENRGKLGVFWHTQGSGKSYSMVFFSQKVLRTVPGNWTFVIVTDRQDLDGQIYRNFASTGAVLEEESRVRADSAESLKRMLEEEDHRYVFTLIQKFRTERGERYPKLSDRSDIIVITDEAHRSQYDVFAYNMRQALPNAAFIGFTGTPLVAGEERTKDVFGDYVSVYNFKQSVDEGNTVPLYYENRIPELQLVNEDLEDDLAQIVEEADLDDDQQRKLEREFAREYHLLTRDERLERIGQDIAAHYMGRGTLAKAMVVSIDKATAVRTYDKVRKHWDAELEKVRKVAAEADPADRQELEERVRFLEETDMAVIVSGSQNELEEMKKKGADIGPHRKRMVKEDLEKKFKEDEDPLRIVFVCAMWITGFDVPSCSTIYLDKPMKNHTLMQTIARANRVWRDKRNGLIVDYVGVFRNLQKALAIYGTARSGAGGASPIESKAELADAVREALVKAEELCRNEGVDVAAIRDARGFERERLKADAVEALVATDELKRRFLVHASHVGGLFKSLLPDERAWEFSERQHVLKILAEKIKAELPPVDIGAVMAEVEALLNRSIAADGYVMPAVGDESRYIDLTQVDFDALREEFEKGRKNTEAQKLRLSIQDKLARMVAVNPTRKNLLEEFQRMIDEYNAGSANVEAFFAKLMAFAQRLNEEEKRGIAEQLTEEELAIFDLLTKPDVKLSAKDERQVKTVAKDLLATLKRERLTLDWRKQMSTRASVRHAIETVLDSELPRAYTPEMFGAKCDAVWQHVYEVYSGYGQQPRV
ncbi:MAG: type I restriction endonuclease subunit R [Myxococcales bacterium]|nr:type I restriction endonuclease subunit R [Myxococcales bacterium]